MEIEKDIILYNNDCFDIFPKIEDKSINLFILDLPYGQTACKWDTIIDLEEMWKHIKRIMKPNALIIFFCTAKFGYNLIHSNPKWFKYDLIWKKSRKVGFLSANKMPLRQHENIYIFKDKQGIYHPQKTKLDKPYTDKRNRKINNCYGEQQQNFIKEHTHAHPTSVIEHENIYIFKDKQGIYNPQKTEGKPYKCGRGGTGYYGELGEDYTKKALTENNGDRHPTSIIENKDLGEIKGGYYRGENGKPFKRMSPSKDGIRHPTSIIDHENIYIFDNTITDDVDLSRNKDLREYAEKVFKFIGKGLKTINKKLGHRKAEHFFYFKTSQFGLCTNETYNQLIEEYNIDEMEEYLEYDILESLWEGNPTYNPQKTEGKPYKKNKKSVDKNNVYNIGTIGNGPENKGDRNPTSIIPEYEGDTILVYKNPHKTIHRTQKPVQLLEWLIKTYSNEGDKVMDFTMGSGTCGIACMNTKRKFIGVEMDKEIFELTKKRFIEHKKNINK
tara:strand:+ start:810 stop:2306 length:1497 start_codon:yes stop_codon:yes gene_type:complete